MMRHKLFRRSLATPLLALGLVLCVGPVAQAGSLAWLDDVVRQAVREAEAGTRAAARTKGPAARVAGRLFTREADESLELLARRSDDLARTARRVEEPTEAALRSRFTRLIRHDPELARTFATLAPAEKRLVVEMGETAQRLARRYPGHAEEMIQQLGTEGMSAVRAFGDDVAETIAKEGAESVNVLRKTGRGGWKFYVDTVLTHKKKLAAAGVLALFLADPDKFVDTTGRVTQYAVEQFSKAGIKLAGAVGGGAARGVENALGGLLAQYGLDSSLTRRVGMIVAGAVAVLAAMILFGLPIRWVVRPLTWPFRAIRGRLKAA
jgi:hypothetical protein